MLPSFPSRDPSPIEAGGEVTDEVAPTPVTVGNFLLLFLVFFLPSLQRASHRANPFVRLAYSVRSVVTSGVGLSPIVCVLSSSSNAISQLFTRGLPTLFFHRAGSIVLRLRGGVFSILGGASPSLALVSRLLCAVVGYVLSG